MAVIYGGGGGGPLGLLGTMMGIGGSLFGAPWMSTLGMGMNAANAAMSGNAGALAQAMAGIANGELGGMQSPAAGNIARTDEANAVDSVVQNIIDREYYNAPTGWPYASPFPNEDQQLEEYLPPVGMVGTGQNGIIPPVGQTISEENKMYDLSPLMPPYNPYHSRWDSPGPPWIAPPVNQRRRW